MAIDTGPTVATADCRSGSLPLVTSVKPVIKTEKYIYLINSRI
jgi:hypothetical protein